MLSIVLITFAFTKLLNYYLFYYVIYLINLYFINKLLNIFFNLFYSIYIWICCDAKGKFTFSFHLFTKNTRYTYII